jgi:hypothetical protein
MSRDQIDEMAWLIDEAYDNAETTGSELHGYEVATHIYNAGYRKQVVDANSATTTGEWKNNHCTNCGMMPMGEEMWTRLDLTPPRFEWFMDYCPNCGAKMKGGEE